MSSRSTSTRNHNKNMSRFEIISWVNSKIQAEIKKIEDLCTGVAYCCMMVTIAPSSINMKQVKMRPMGKSDYLDNLCLLQDAFGQLKIKQLVPIDLIIQGRFKHNFEFIKTFMDIYDAQTKLLQNQDSKPIMPIKSKSSLAIIPDNMQSKVHENQMPQDPEMSVKSSANVKPTIKSKQRAKDKDQKDDINPDGKARNDPDKTPIQMYQEMPVKSLNYLAKMKPANKEKRMANNANKKKDLKPEREVQHVLDQALIPINPKMQVNPKDIQHEMVQVPWVEEVDKLREDASKEIMPCNETQDYEIVQAPWVKLEDELAKDIQPFTDAPALIVSPYYFYYSPGWQGRRWRSEGFLNYTHLAPSE